MKKRCSKYEYLETTVNFKALSSSGKMLQRQSQFCLERYTRLCYKLSQISTTWHKMEEKKEHIRIEICFLWIFQLFLILLMNWDYQFDYKKNYWRNQTKPLAYFILFYSYLSLCPSFTFCEDGLLSHGHVFHLHFACIALKSNEWESTEHNYIFVFEHLIILFIRYYYSLVNHNTITTAHRWFSQKQNVIIQHRSVRSDVTGHIRTTDFSNGPYFEN